MNGKKAKAIRRLAKEDGKYSTTPDYRIKETKKKMIYGYDDKDTPRAQEIECRVIVNLSKLYYRNLKKAYVNGEFTI